MRNIWIVFLLFAFLFGSGRYLSPLPLPKTYFIDLDIYPCDEYCLQEHLQNGEYLSFMAKVDKKSALKFKDTYLKLARKLNAFSLLPTPIMRLTLLYHKRLKPYSNRASKAILSYFLTQNQPFTLRVDSFEDAQELQTKIDADEANLFILLISYSQLPLLEEIESAKPIFIPTIHKAYSPLHKDFFYFGGVDYPNQSQILTSLNSNKLALFYLKNSYLSTQITKEFNSTKEARLYAVDASVQNLRSILAHNKELNSSTAVFNTPLVKTALILSQMRLYGIKPRLKLSTQINYNPKLFYLTRPKERQGLIIATNIAPLPKNLQSHALIFGDGLEFDWVGYSSVVGVDKFLDSKPLFHEEFIDNQLEFQTILKQVSDFSFEAYQKAP